MKKSQTTSKSLTKPTKPSSKKISGTPVKTIKKTSKKISSASGTEKKKDIGEKAVVKLLKVTAKGKRTPLSKVKTTVETDVISKKTKKVETPVTKKLFKAVKGIEAKLSGPKTKAKPAAVQPAIKTKQSPKAPKAVKKIINKVPAEKSEKTSVKVTKAAKTPEKKPVKKSPAKTVAVKSATKKKKTIKPLSAKKPSVRKSSEVAARKKEEKTEKKIKVSAKTKITAKKTSVRKIKKTAPMESGVKTIKAVRTIAKPESATKAVKSAAKTLKTIPEKKPATGKALPKIKETVKQKAALKPKEKGKKPVATVRKPVKKRAASPFITEKPLPAASEKTAATYIAHFQAETKIEKPPKLKIFLPEDEVPQKEVKGMVSLQLPEEYGENELLLMEVDPSIVFVSWEIKPVDISGETGSLILRVYDVTGIDFDGSHANRFFDITLEKRVDSKFIDIKMSGKDVIMEVGILGPEGRFKAIKRSNRVSMPDLQTFFEEFGIAGSLTDPDTIIGY